MKNLLIALILLSCFPAISQVIFTPNVAAMQRKDGDTTKLSAYHSYLKEYSLKGDSVGTSDFKRLKKEARDEVNNADFLPLSGLPYASIYFQPDTENVYTNTVISVLANDPTYFTEVAYDYIGSFRVSVAASAAKVDSIDSVDTQDNLTKYFQSPGTAMFRADLPLFLYTTVSPTRGSFIGIYFSSKLVADIPGVGNGYTTLKGSWDNAFEIQFSATGDKNKLRMIGVVRGGSVQGFNSKFTELGTEADWLWYCTTSFGIGLKDISVLINNPIGGYFTKDLKAKVAPTISTNINLFSFFND